MTRAARAYRLIEAGYTIFPSSVTWDAEGEKHSNPLVKWKTESSNDPEQIEKWWRTWPNAFPCIACEPSKIVVADCDKKHCKPACKTKHDHCTPDCKSGTERWDDDAFTLRTSSGGRHYLYSADPDSPVATDNTGKLDRHVDIRATGGMIIVHDCADLTDLPEPGDLKPVPEEVLTKVPYLKTTEPNRFELPARPFTLEAAIEFCKPAMDTLKVAPRGQINSLLNDAACQFSHFIDVFWTEKDITDWLIEAQRQAWVNAGGRDDGDYSAALKTIKSGLHQKRDPWKATPVKAEFTSATPTAHPQVSELDLAVIRERIRREARRLVDSEEHAQFWTPPNDFGNLSNELTLPNNEPPWRVRKLLGFGHNAILVAGRKAGKTTVVNSLVRALVDSEPFLNRFDVTDFNGSVAVFNYEVEKNQYREWLRRAGIINTDRVHLMHMRGKSLPLANKHVQDWLIDWLKERNVKVLILDPYSRAYIGSIDNGNDEAVVSKFLDTIDQIKERAGVSELVMPVHTPKSRVEAGDESAIGSQRLEAWADGLWYIMRGDKELRNMRYFRAEIRGAEVDEEQLQYDPDTGRITMGGYNRSIDALRQKEDDILKYIEENPGSGVNDIVTGTNMRKSTAGKVLDSMVERRVLDRFEGPNRSKLHYIGSGSHRSDCPCTVCTGSDLRKHAEMSGSQSVGTTDFDMITRGGS